MKALPLYWDSSEAPARRGGGLGTCGSLPGTQASLSAFSEAFRMSCLGFLVLWLGKEGFSWDLFFFFDLCSLAFLGHWLLQQQVWEV